MEFLFNHQVDKVRQRVTQIIARRQRDRPNFLLSSSFKGTIDGIQVIRLFKLFDSFALMGFVNLSNCEPLTTPDNNISIFIFLIIGKQ